VSVAFWNPGGSQPIVAQPRGALDRPNVVRPAADSAQEPVAGFPGATVSPARTIGSVDGPTQWRAVDVSLVLGPGDDSSQSLVAVVAAPLSEVDATVDRVRLLIVGLGGGVVLLCALLGWLAIRRSFQPLVEVEETAAAIAAGDLSRRIPERPASTEVGRLTTSLNGMLTQIESAFRARAASEARTRRFAADASHELRTPLASIRGFAELYRQGAVPPDDVPRTMRRIEDEATRMGGLVEDLLLLARLDERRPARSEPVDLAVLAGDAVHDVRGLDPERPVRLTGLQPGTGPVPTVVVGDEGGLRQVVTNLVANAVRHTPDGTPVEVAVGVEPASQAAAGDGNAAAAGDRPCAVLEVRDHGAGLPPDEAGKIFERFYRVDSSRRRGNGGGSGLGLSIVSAVTAAHGGTVDVRTTPGGGATFRVALPLATQPSASAPA
jgi:two-component system OmpR family sensor kinase